ncbi:hypothetical protein TKV_c21680 [Thermoanaerobacter kivui]|uniref:Uncharacterized protein n=1 Tax=Thermoanaerobacter kivui TaxID=2325 RepID=A0A097AU18_THEKI|nr:hypothetical protein [Thermoanaerobacter kivui]AIS53300.1 hypothetical protein TKV_c21680 [Thermoanaerobacter kivui]
MKWYKLIFKQNQPIHIGSIEWGVINETEIFIPGWTMWGALTHQYLKTNGFNEIDKAKKIFEHITNFYPAVTCEKDGCLNTDPLFPKYKKGNFYIGDYLEEQFKFEFVDTIVSTAVEPLSRKAKDESLHEFEFVLPRSKQDGSSSKQLYWIGLIGFEEEVIKDINSLITNGNNDQDIKENDKNDESKKNEDKDYNDFLLDVFSKVYIGGDSKYGFGELELIVINELKDGEGNADEGLKKWDVDENGYLFLDDSDNSLILKQFFEFSREVKFEGELKLLAEFDFTQNNPKVENAGYFVNIGSKIIIDNKTSKNSKELKNYRLFKGKLIKDKKQ